MSRALAVSLALSGAACVHIPPLRPAQAEQAVPGDPGAATAQAGGVKVTVHADAWRGYPGDIGEYLTPVEILIENDSAEELRVGPKRFALLGPNGFRYEPLPPGEVRRWLRPHRHAAIYYEGWFGYYPWPGRPWGWRHYPYYYWWGPRAVVVVPAPAPEAPPPPPRGTLGPGGKVGLLLFFPVPAHQLGSLTVEARLVSKGGKRIGEVQLPFERADPHARRLAPPPAARPPSPPPQAPPPAPPQPPPPGAGPDDGEADL